MDIGTDPVTVLASVTLLEFLSITNPRALAKSSMVSEGPVTPLISDVWAGTFPFVVGIPSFPFSLTFVARTSTD